MAVERSPATGAQRGELALAEIIEANAWADLVAAAPPSFASAIGLRCERRSGATCILAPGAPVNLLNRAIGLGCDEPASEAGLREIVALYRDAGVRRFWIHRSPAAEPPLLDEWLRDAGLAPDPVLRAWAKVVRGTEPCPTASAALQIALVDERRGPELGRVLAAAHGMPPTFAAWFGPLSGRPGWRVYAALDGDRVVAGGLLYTSGPHAWLGAGGTLPTHRGRGAQGALMARRIADAMACGCTIMATETGDDTANPSLRNMLRAGFRRVGSRINYGPAQGSR